MGDFQLIRKDCIQMGSLQPFYFHLSHDALLAKEFRWQVYAKIIGKSFTKRGHLGAHVHQSHMQCNCCGKIFLFYSIFLQRDFMRDFFVVQSDTISHDQKHAQGERKQK